MLDSLSSMKKGFLAHTLCVQGLGRGAGATITSMSKTLGHDLFLKCSLGNSPGCQTTSAELQDSHHRVSPKSGAETHWSVLQGPEVGVTEAVEQIRKGMQGKGEKLRDGSFQKHLQLCNCCKFSLWPPTNLTSQASSSPQRGSPCRPLLPLPLFQPFHLLSSHRLSHITTQHPPRRNSHFSASVHFCPCFPFLLECLPPSVLWSVSPQPKPFGKILFQKCQPFLETILFPRGKDPLSQSPLGLSKALDKFYLTPLSKLSLLYSHIQCPINKGSALSKH